MHEPTERLQKLFANVPGVAILDTSVPCLARPEILEMLRNLGVADRIRPVKGEWLTGDERRALREGRWLGRGHEQEENWNLTGLEELLETLQHLPAEERVKRARLLWEELLDLRRDDLRKFEATYRWSSRYTDRAVTRARFVQVLGERAWVPDERGGLHRPELIEFERLESLGWRKDEQLLNWIRFREPAVAELARTVGIEPEAVYLLRSLGIATAADLRKCLGLETAGTQFDTQPSGQPGAQVLGTEIADGRHGSGLVARQEQESTPVGPVSHSESVPRRRFVSYVAVSHFDDVSDPDGLTSEERLSLENTAVQWILDREPTWQRMPHSNPGFDLMEVDAEGRPVRWCEVKAMSGSLQERPVTVSKAQFEFAQRTGAAFWLYVVENAGTNRKRLVKIRDPAGNARAFTFDEGWREIAEIDSPLEGE